MLTERQAEILKVIVREYSETALPVGSSSLKEKYNLAYSSATLRGEMAKLEQKGFLNQPHISAGRVPSDKGYRYFIDNLIGRDKTDLNYQKRLELELLLLKTKNARLERTTAKLLSTMSNCLAITGTVDKNEFFDFGMHNLLEDPEFSDQSELSKLVMALDVIDENLEEILKDVQDGETKVFIGEENPIQGVENCSMIISPYQKEDGERGLLAIIGPKRMKYKRNKELINLMKRVLGNQKYLLMLPLVINLIK